MTTREKPPLPTLDDFPVKASDTIRYGDTDKLGHVNNAVFSTFLETGRTRLLWGGAAAVAPEHASFVLARLVLDYRAEMLWPGEALIGTGVLSVGNSSITLSQAIFQGERCTATAETVLVLFDMVTRRPQPLPEESRARLADLKMRRPG
ncbi:acyl-CoA thioesterase [Xanthobacter versatilis]|uniref:acyl-CoA thioesterase n=1 Tax=Xanthobacter autotrophicus (strain ATCC BAA-1158 / Py2) TaxID=78245 RepID=UPI00372C7A85